MLGTAETILVLMWKHTTKVSAHMHIPWKPYAAACLVVDFFNCKQLQSIISWPILAHVIVLFQSFRSLRLLLRKFYGCNLCYIYYAIFLRGCFHEEIDNVQDGKNASIAILSLLHYIIIVNIYNRIQIGIW